MISRKRSSVYIILLLALMLLGGNFLGCQKEDWTLDVDCGECFDFYPDSVDLLVYVSIRPEQDSVPLTFYRGDSEGEIDWQDTATTQTFRLFSKVGSTYTVKAEYRSGSTSIIAFDSDEMTISNQGNECGVPCYIVKGGTFDVRLEEE